MPIFSHLLDRVGWSCRRCSSSCASRLTTTMLDPLAHAGSKARMLRQTTITTTVPTVSESLSVQCMECTVYLLEPQPLRRHFEPPHRPPEAPQLVVLFSTRKEKVDHGQCPRSRGLQEARSSLQGDALAHQCSTDRGESTPTFVCVPILRDRGPIDVPSHPNEKRLQTYMPSAARIVGWCRVDVFACFRLLSKKTGTKEGRVPL